MLHLCLLFAPIETAMLSTVRTAYKNSSYFIFAPRPPQLQNTLYSKDEISVTLCTRMYPFDNSCIIFIQLNFEQLQISNKLKIIHFKNSPQIEVTFSPIDALYLRSDSRFDHFSPT